MWSFFHGWRRKAGTVTLVIACVLMAAWIRSTIVVDSLLIATNNGRSFHKIRSGEGFFRWDYCTNTTSPKFLGFPRYPFWEAYPAYSRQSIDSLPTTWDPDAEDAKGFLAEDEIIQLQAGRPKSVPGKWELCGLKIGTGKAGFVIPPAGPITALDFRVTIIPYRVFVIPLALLSACLLVWRPRQRKHVRNSGK